MRLVFGLVLLIGVGLAGFAVYMAQGYIKEYEVALAAEREAQQEIVPVTDIYVAAEALRYGQPLTPENVRLIKFPEQSLPEGAFRDAESLFPNDNQRPRTVLRAIEPNEPILAVKVGQPGQEAGIAAFLAPGMRAFTINVNVTTGVSGFLSPGDRVDVFWSGQNMTKLIQPSVKIIGINQSADQDRMETTVARTVTVEVAPAEVAALAQAQSSGTLSLALVGALDTTASASDIQVNQRQLLGVPEAQVEEVRETCYRTERRGSEVRQIEVPCTD